MRREEEPGVRRGVAIGMAVAMAIGGAYGVWMIANSPSCDGSLCALYLLSAFVVMPPCVGVSVAVSTKQKTGRIAIWKTFFWTIVSPFAAWLVLSVLPPVVGILFVAILVLFELAGIRL